MINALVAVTVAVLLAAIPLTVGMAFSALFGRWS